MYDPTIGRWISEDPLGFETADANLYRYVGNRPAIAMDPSGLFETRDNTRRNLYNDVTSAIGDNTIGLVVGAFVDRFGRDRLLDGIPRLNPAGLPRTPAGWTVVDVVGGQHKWGIVPPRTLFGPSGTQTCTGLILVPIRPTIPMDSGFQGAGCRLETYAFHFSALDNVSSTLHANFLFQNSNASRLAARLYQAVLCGARRDNNPDVAYETGRTLSNVIDTVRSAGISIYGYVPGPNVHVDRAGAIFWTYTGNVTEGY